MSAFKQFTTKDVTITPFEADKSFRFVGNDITGSDVGIDIYYGRNVDYGSTSDLVSGFVSPLSASVVYNSAKQLYYSNYRTSSMGDDYVTQSVVPGVSREYDRYVGPIEAPRYENYLQSSLTQSRYLTTGSGDNITTISIPTKLFGENIVPYTFEFTFTGSATNPVFLTDDGDGNIISASVVVGQIFYSHGTIVLGRNTAFSGGPQNIGVDLYIDDGYLQSASIAFSSSITLYEQQYKCTIRENEFGYSLNPSLLTGSSDNEYYPFVTGSYFTPYITTVGLYNESTELIAIGKLSQPIPISQFTDTTIMVNFDV